MKTKLPTDAELSECMKVVFDAVSSRRRSPFPMQHAMLFEGVARQGLRALHLLEEARALMTLEDGHVPPPVLLDKINKALAAFQQQPLPPAAAAEQETPA